MDVVVSLCGGYGAVETFPRRPLRVSQSGTKESIEYDLAGDGAADYREITNDAGRIVSVEKLPGQDSPGWSADLDAVDPKKCRHIFLLLDGVPYDLVELLYEQGLFRTFHPPQRVITCFPPMTDPAYAVLFDAGRPLGFEAKYYDKETNTLSDGSKVYLRGLNRPAYSYMRYRPRPFYAALQYGAPNLGMRGELCIMLRRFREAKDRAFFAYIASTSGLGTTEGWTGIVKYLERLDRLAHQLIMENRGNVKVTMLADHGHTLMPAEEADLAAHLRQSGFRVTKKIRSDNDVVLIRLGLITNAVVYTRRPASVAQALIGSPAVNLCIYPEDDWVTVMNEAGKGRIFEKNGRFRYDDSEGDPLEMRPILARLAAEGACDRDGFVDKKKLFEETFDHTYPDALYCLWRAFHGLVQHPPDLAVTLHDNYMNHNRAFSFFVKANSTHGSLNNLNMTTFVMSTARAFERPLRMEDLKAVFEEMTGQHIRPVRPR
jgi:hypothetical protein